MKKKIPLLILLFIFFFRVEAQNQNKVASLEIVLKNSKQETSKVKALLLLADELRNNDPEKSIQYSKQALDLSNKLNFKKGIGHAEVLIGIASFNLGSYDEALKYLSQGLETSRSINDQQTSSRALNSIGLVYTNRGSYADAFKNCSGAIKLLRGSDKKETADCYSNIGVTYEKQGKYDEAIKFQSMALNLRKQIGDRQGIAASLNFIGMVYRRQGDFAAAMQNYLAALKIQEDTGDNPGRAYSLQNIGIINILQSNYSDAMKNLSASLKIFETIKNEKGIADSYGNIGWCYGAQDKYSESLISTRTALEIFKSMGDRQNMALYYNNIGFNYYKQGNTTEAMKNLLVAAQLFEEIEDKANVAETYESIGEAYSVIGNYPASITWLNKGLKTATQISEKRIVKESYDALAKVYAKLNDYKNAYKFHTLYTDIKELIDEESSRKVAEMKTKYETDKKEKEIQLLNKDKQIQSGEIKRQTIIKNAILAGVGFASIFAFFLFRSFNRRRKTDFERQVTVVEMTALRSQMNPHFIFNSLHSINNYMMDNDKKNASDYLGKFSKLMRLILENSREQEVTLEKDLLTLELYMELEAMRFENKFTCKIEVAEGIDPENILVPPMILQPFVENSILHGLQNKEKDGKILIRVEKENDMIVCIVEDNGVGREKAMEMKEKTTAHKGESLGMKITNARIDIINKIKKANASVSLIDLTEGMRVEVKLPLELAF